MLHLPHYPSHSLQNMKETFGWLLNLCCICVLVCLFGSLGLCSVTHTAGWTARVQMAVQVGRACRYSFLVRFKLLGCIVTLSAGISMEVHGDSCRNINFWRFLQNVNARHFQVSRISILLLVSRIDIFLYINSRGHKIS